MSASITITLQVKVSTQRNDKVAVTGAHKALGEWDPDKVRFMKPKKSADERSVKFIFDLSIMHIYAKYIERL